MRCHLCISKLGFGPLYLGCTHRTCLAQSPARSQLFRKSRNGLLLETEAYFNGIDLLGHGSRAFGQLRAFGIDLGAYRFDAVPQLLFRDLQASQLCFGSGFPNRCTSGHHPASRLGLRARRRAALDPAWVH